MTTLVVGANGASGKWLVKNLLSLGHHVKVIVRSSSIIPDYWENSNNVTIIRADISDMNVDEMSNHIKDCQAVTSCLGHNMTVKGLFGKPRRLVTNAVQLICSAIHKNSPESPVRVVIMNTAGNSNRDLDEPVSVGQKFVVGLIRLILPPHTDNEDAADVLRLHIGQKNPCIEWVVVRPDSLINDKNVTRYEVYPSPIRSAIFNPGKTSRINVGHFMAELITTHDLWNQWKGQMPVIYNKSD